MNKLFFLLLLSFSLLMSCHNNVSIYSMGYTYNASGSRIPGYWYNSKWIQLETPDIEDCETCDIYITKKRVLVGGCIDTPSRRWVPGYWDDSIWNELPLPDDATGGFVNNILVNNKDIYAAGSCYTKSGIPVCGYWKNGNWFSLSPANTDKGLLISFTIDRNNIYWIGNYDHNFSDKNNSGYYINNKWVDLPIPKYYLTGEAKRIVIINKDIYILGLCTDSNGKMTACYWKNSLWHSFPSKNSERYNQVWSLTRNGNDIYTAVNQDGYWKNDRWIEFKTNKNETCSIRSIKVLGKDVYAAGHIYTGKKCVPGYWKNDQWIELELPYTNTQSLNALDFIVVVNE
jgi:hypothetical protein